VIADLDPTRIAALLRTRWVGRSLEVRAETDSTNDDARIAADAGALHGHVIVADCQQAGRGAHGRAWDSPSGSDLYVSIVARIHKEPAEVPPLTLAIGEAVAACVNEVLGRDIAQIKWPNDVLIDGKKCAGILLETSTLGRTLGPVIIGMGLNVHRRTFEGDLAGVATSLALHTEASLHREVILARLLELVEGSIDRFEAAGELRAQKPKLNE